MVGAPIELLAGVELFGGLNARELKAIAGSMKEHRYEAGRNVVTEGQKGVGFFVIAAGTATVTIAGGEVRTLGPGDSFGEIALVTEAGRTATITAETDLTCWGLPSWAFRPIVESNPSIASKLQQEMSRLLTDSPS
jgi:CRP-like cAMP-binding protein